MKYTSAAGRKYPILFTPGCRGAGRHLGRVVYLAEGGEGGCEAVGRPRPQARQQRAPGGEGGAHAWGGGEAGHVVRDRCRWQVQVAGAGGRCRWQVQVQVQVQGRAGAGAGAGAGPCRCRCTWSRVGSLLASLGRLGSV